MRRNHLLPSLVALSALLLPIPASAGPVELLNQAFVHDAQPDLIALRYDNGGGGLLVSRDGGASFELLCSAALGLGGERASTGAITGDGQLLIGTFRGLRRDDRTGCGFAADIGLADRWVTDFAADPSAPSAVFAVTGRAAPAENGLWRSADGGEFVALGSSAPVLITRLRVVRRGGAQLRFYVGALAGEVMVDLGRGPELRPNYVIRVSDDDGEHWVEHALPPTLGGVRLEAVDPTNPDRIAVSVTHIGALDQLLVSEDEGRTFDEVATVAALTGVVIDRAGRIYISDAGEPGIADSRPGLWRIPRAGATATPLGDSRAVTCLAYRASDDTLYACERITFGSVDPQSGALQPSADLRHVDRFVDCPGADVRAACETQMVDAYCGITHFPCAPACDAYGVDLSPLADLAAQDPSVAACFARRGGASAAGTGAPVVPDPMNAEDAASAGAETGPTDAPDASVNPAPRRAPTCTLAGGRSAGSAFAIWALLGLAQWRLVRARSNARSRKRRT